MANSDRWLSFFAGAVIVILLVFLTFFMFSDRLGIKEAMLPKWNLTALFHPEEKLLQKIRASTEMKDLNKSKEWIAEFLGNYPESKYKTDVYWAAATVFFENKDYPDSRKYCEKILAADNLPNSLYIKTAILLGKIAHENENYDPQIFFVLDGAYVKAGGNEKDELSVYLGYQYLYRKDLTNALRLFNSAPGEDGVIGRARVYIEGGNYLQAIQEYNNYFSAYAKNSRYDRVKEAFIKQSLYYSGKLAEAKRFSEAIYYYRNMAALFPRDAEADVAGIEMARLYEAEKEFAKADQSLEWVLRNEPKNEDEAALFEKGVLYYAWGKPGESLKILREYLDKYPSGRYSGKASEWAELAEKTIQN